MNRDVLSCSNVANREFFFFVRKGPKRSRNENVYARPSRLRENPETAISCRRPGPARNKKEVYQYVVERRRKMHACALVAKQSRVELT